jgi:hypothetical protein
MKYGDEDGGDEDSLYLNPEDTGGLTENALNALIAMEWDNSGKQGNVMAVDVSFFSDFVCLSDEMCMPCEIRSKIFDTDVLFMPVNTEHSYGASHQISTAPPSSSSSSKTEKKAPATSKTKKKPAAASKKKRKKPAATYGGVKHFVLVVILGLRQLEQGDETLAHPRVLLFDTFQREKRPTVDDCQILKLVLKWLRFASSQQQSVGAASIQQARDRVDWSLAKATRRRAGKPEPPASTVLLASEWKHRRQLPVPARGSFLRVLCRPPHSLCSSPPSRNFCIESIPICEVG